jgi:hypothetical protein
MKLLFEVFISLGDSKLPYRMDYGSEETSEPNRITSVEWVADGSRVRSP